MAANGVFTVRISSELQDRLDAIAGDETVWEQEPLERLAAAAQLAAFRHDGFWQPMDTMRDKNVLEDRWANGRAEWKTW